MEVGSENIINQFKSTIFGRFFSKIPFQPLIEVTLNLQVFKFKGQTGSCGATDNASAYGAEDSRFESWQDRIILAQSNKNTLLDGHKKISTASSVAHPST